MDREHLCDSLLKWLQTFTVDAPCENIDDLTDGVAMATVLHVIAPNFFNDSWMSKIKFDVSNNWRLKVSNLKKVLKGILDYYAEVLGQQIQDFHMPDVNAIGEHGDRAELGRLLQLILGCAVNCDDKQEYIQRIMSMEEAVQHVVMNAIQELMTKETPTSSGDGYSEVNGSGHEQQMKRALEELNTVMEAKEEMAQRCHVLDLQVAALQEEKVSLVAENDRLNERLNQADSLEDPRIEFLSWKDWPDEWKSTPAGRRYQQLQNQVEHLQDELYRIEAAKDDYRIKVELQEKELLELHQKNDELSALAEEARTLKDEMDILKHTTDKVAKYEATIESYKKKLEELSDLRGQVKILEDKNTAYMKKNMELEEEVKKSATLRSQLDVYKRQTQELQSKISEETKRADKAEFESKRLGEKMTALQREKERLIAERDSLKETNEELTYTQVQKEMLMTATPSTESSSMAYSNLNEIPISQLKPPESLQGDAAMLLDSSLDMVAVPPEIKEKLIRLQHENKMLKLQRTASEDEQGQLLQSQLDDANARKNELESESRILNQRILELEAQLEDLQESQRQSDASSSTESVSLRQKLAESTRRIQTLESDLSKKEKYISELEPKLAGSMEKVTQLQELLARKDEEMKAMEERYKKYLEKAKTVIRTLDSKNNVSSGGEMQMLRNQLQEKDRLIEHLEKDHDKAKSIREQEEKLIVTAWYNMGMQLNRKAAEERLSNSGAGQSFLSRQRQAHTRRPQTSTSPHILSGPSR